MSVSVPNIEAIPSIVSDPYARNRNQRIHPRSAHRASHSPGLSGIEGFDLPPAVSYIVGRNCQLSSQAGVCSVRDRGIGTTAVVNSLLPSGRTSPHASDDILSLPGLFVFCWLRPIRSSHMCGPEQSVLIAIGESSFLRLRNALNTGNDPDMPSTGSNDNSDRSGLERQPRRAEGLLPCRATMGSFSSLRIFAICARACTDHGPVESSFTYGVTSG